ncbi:MAG: hypothetical protein P0116_04845 [Candidatus Nitrosocosmicus sp.]|nr:hypothetical protein [Candidatus Nitrosocosmicus sp.]
MTIATLVFSVSESGVGHATTGIDLGNNPAQSNQVPGLKSDPNDNDDNNNDKSSNNNNDNNKNNNNDDNNNDKSSNNNNDNNDDNNNDKSSSSSSTTTTTSSSSSKGDVPMALPFNSNMADESDDEKDYSSVIPFP